MRAFDSQATALNHLSSIAETSGKLLALEEVMDTHHLNLDSETVIAGKAHDQSQEMLFDAEGLHLGTDVLLGSFACRILLIYPEAAKYFDKQLGLSADEEGAVIIRGRLEYTEPRKEEPRARRLAAYCIKQGASQLLDVHFATNTAIPSTEVFSRKSRLLRGFAMTQGTLMQEDEAPQNTDPEVAILHRAIDSYPHLELMSAELGFSPTLLPALAAWIDPDQSKLTYPQ